MKKIVKLQYTTTVIVLLLLTAASTQAQQWNGTWRVNLNKTLSLMDTEWQDRYDSLTTNGRTRANNTMANREFIFASDGTVTINWKSQDTDKQSAGTWSSTGTSGGTLTITVDGRVVEFAYEFRSASVLILRSSEKRGFFNNLWLEKQ